MKIGLFFGTFDPVTKAHLKIIKTMPVDKVIVVPAKAKYIDTKNEKISTNLFFTEEYRIELLSLAIKEANIINCDISRIEIDNSIQLKTYETLKLLKEQYGDNEYYLVFGDDKLKELRYWYKAAKLLKENFFYIVSRNFTVNEISNFIETDDFLSQYKNSFKNIYSFENKCDIPISSTNVRENIFTIINAKVSLKALLPKSVLNKIGDDFLYG